MTKTGNILTLALLAALPALSLAADKPLTVKAVNKLPFARPSQTIELSAKDLAPLGADLTQIHVKDATGKELLCQALDSNFDRLKKLDTVIFQADFAPGETKSFSVSTGEKMAYTKDQMKAHGRFVRERFDDFAWENDRIAHRVYGKALETWAGEPLVSSSVDIWSKRVTRMVIDDWYMMDTYAGTGGNYHIDKGEGCDDYSAGATRGNGAIGFWANNRLWVSSNFVDSRVAANGPIRVMFELVYDAFDVNGAKVSEVKRVTLDAGSQLDHYQSTFKAQGGSEPLVCAIGLKKVRGDQRLSDTNLNWLAVWEPMEQPKRATEKMGIQGVAAIVDPKLFGKQAEDPQNNLMLAKLGPDNVVSYWAGFAWDKAGVITTPEAWKTYVDQFTQGLASPIAVSVSAE